MKCYKRNPPILAMTLALAAPFASAHVVMRKWTAYAGCQEYVTLAVPHGCGDSPTTEVRVKIPEDKAGWTTRIIKRRLPTPIVGEGGARITEVVDEIAWFEGTLALTGSGSSRCWCGFPTPPGRCCSSR